MSLENSVFKLKDDIYNLIQKGVVGEEVLLKLLPNGEPLLYERELWDYKSELPVELLTKNPNNTIKSEYSFKMSEIVKDAVSFYNSYGGYLVIGVSDKPRSINGFDKCFDVDVLNKKIKGATGVNIECCYSLIEYFFGQKMIKIGLLFVPQRRDKYPIVFNKDGEVYNNKKAYAQGSFYFRDADECRPAVTPEDYAFLYSQRSKSVQMSFSVDEILDNNLGASDPGLIEFIGRENYLSELWCWLSEKYSPCKLLAGIGGVGKTTIARKFAESIVSERPLEFQRVIWLSAKTQYFRTYKQSIEKASRYEIDFSDSVSLLKSLISQLGGVDDDFCEDDDLNDLISKAIDALAITPAFVIIDDLDSLSPTEQQVAYHTVNQIFSQTIRKNSRASSRALLTARLDLGAPPSQLVRVRGLELNEFKNYLYSVARKIQIPDFKISQHQLNEFHTATDGSPIFAYSILKLSTFEKNLSAVINKWKGGDGEEVRRFAFKREIEQLNNHQLRILWALCVLKSSSLIELESVLDINKSKLLDSISDLHKYHLILMDSEFQSTGYDISVPNNIVLMSSIVKNHVSDFNKIKNKCDEYRKDTGKNEKVGKVISEVVILWKNNSYEDALSIAKAACTKHSREPDLHLLVARCLLKVPKMPKYLSLADAKFREAHRIGCKRSELYKLWIETRESLQDYTGVIDIITELEDKKRGVSPEFIYSKAQAIKNLGDIYYSRNEIKLSGNKYIEAIKYIQSSFENKKAMGYVQELLSLKRNLAWEYMKTINETYQDQADYIYIWFACVDLFDLHVKSASLILSGLGKLSQWWSVVNRRSDYDDKAVNLLSSQLNKLTNMLKSMDDSAEKEEIVDIKDKLNLMYLCKYSSLN